LLFSVQDHKQCLCHIIFCLFIKYLTNKGSNRSGKAASVFRLWASQRQAGLAYCRPTRQISAKRCVAVIASARAVT
jgi:hypothetical protein